MSEIEQIIAEHRPHVLGISESNFLAKHNIEDVHVSFQDDYTTLKLMVTFKDDEEICMFT